MSGLPAHLDRAQALTEDELRRVLTEPKSALVKQFRTQLAMSDAELHITGGALRTIAATAVHKGTGARGLRTILEDLLHQAQFEVRLSGRCCICMHGFLHGLCSSVAAQAQVCKRVGSMAWLQAGGRAAATSLASHSCTPASWVTGGL